MSDDRHNPPVSEWFRRIRTGDPAAATELWDFYSPMLIAVARQMLRNTRRAAEDEDDVLASVFESLWGGAQRGRFADISHRNELWGLLLCITHQKATNVKRRAGAKKRGGDVSHDNLVADFVPDLRPDAAAIVEMREELDRLLKRLSADDLREIAMLKLQGFLDREIAMKLNIAVRSVERKLKMIRQQWIEALDN